MMRSGYEILRAVTLKAREPFTGNVSQTKTFVGTMQGFVIANDGVENLTVNINGMNFTVRAGEVFSELFEPFKTVVITIAGTTEYRAYGRG